MVKRVNALKARQNLGELLETVHYNGDQYIIERAGKPMAAVVPVWQLEEWQQHRKRFFSTIDEVWKKNKDAVTESVEHEVQNAVNAVRKQANRKKT